MLFRSVKELLVLARQKPGSLNYGSAGPGSSSHLAAALFASAAGIDTVHVPYKGSAQAATELVGGQIQFVFEAIGAATQYHRSGRLRALGVSTLKRSPGVPEVPTIAEAGVPGYEMSPWVGVFVPAGTPKAIIDKLNSEINRLLQTEDVRNRFQTLGVAPLGGTPEALGKYLEFEIVRWARLIKDTGVKLK